MTVRAVGPAAPDAVWDRYQRPDRWHEWSPQIRSVDYPGEIIAAGGTGGHMIPAHALAGELMSRGHHVALITDERGSRIPGLFDRVPVHVLPAGRISKNPIKAFKAFRAIMTGRAMAMSLVVDSVKTFFSASS